MLNNDKAFDFSTLIDAKIGGDVHSMTYSWGRYAGTLSETIEGRETGIVGNGVMSDGNGGFIPNNQIVTAKAYNQASFSNGVESSPVTVSISFNGEQAKTDLYLFSIGINNYKNSKYNLKYAKNDAKSFVTSLKKGGDSLFNKIYTYNLNDKSVTKENIAATISEIQKVIGPEDVFVFYYAGHGTMSAPVDKKSGEFYIVTHDVTNLYGDVAMLDSIAVSAKQLMQYSMKLDAQKQLFVLDACHSGGALHSLATRGDGREKALAQLARSTGTYFLTASQDAQYANEAGDLKHGLFTYALLEILQGKTTQALDKKVTINEMKSYVEDRVPQLSEKYHGSVQYPTSYSFGQDFPIVILK